MENKGMTKRLIFILLLFALCSLLSTSLFAMGRKPKEKPKPPAEEAEVEEIVTTEEEVKEEEKKKPRPPKKPEEAIKEKIRDIELVP